MIFIILTGILFILISNLFSFRRLDQYPAPNNWPKVSILIPARNEELTINSCIESLLDQDYGNFEILVLDDESTDNTLSILNELAKQNILLKVIYGKPVPSGWVGKNWACDQLSKLADGDYI